MEAHNLSVTFTRNNGREGADWETTEALALLLEVEGVRAPTGTDSSRASFACSG